MWTSTPTFERFVPAVDAWRGPVCLSPDAKQLAFRTVRGAGWYDVVLANASGEGASHTRLSGTRDLLPIGLEFAPDGRWLACLATSPQRRRRLHLLSLDEGSPRHEVVEAEAYAFKPDGTGVSLLRRGRLVDHAFDGRERDVVAIEGDVDPSLPANISISPDGTRRAVLTHRRDDDAALLWIVEGDRAPRLLSDVPGWVARCRAAWSPDGRDLAVYIAHPAHRHSALIVFYDGAGEGEVFFDSDRAEPIEGLCWAPTGAHLVTTRTPALGVRRPRLMTIDLAARAIADLGDDGPPAGRCRFDGARFVVEAHDAAYRVRLGTKAN